MSQGNTPQASSSFEIAERFKAAVQRGDAEAVADMIAEGLDVNAQDADDGMAALHHAAAFAS